MLPKANRLRQKKDFKRVYQRGKSLSMPYFVLYWHKSYQSEARIGFSISKKIGKAVARNRLKRQCRAIIKDHLANFAPKYDYILVLRQAAAKSDYNALSGQLVQAMQRQAKISQSKPEKK